MNAPLVIAQPQAVKLTVADYHLLDGSGAFDFYRRTELVDGTVYAVSPVHRPYGFARDGLAYRLRRALEAQGSRFTVATETSVDMTPVSEPIPDIIVTDAPRGDGAIPLGSVALLVEVSTSTLAFDLADKARLYAAAGVPEYWVVDVAGATVHQMWTPGPDGYVERREAALGGLLESATLADFSVETGGLV